jgi:hypothetical protein
MVFDAVGVTAWGGMTPNANSTPLHKPSKSEAEYNSEVHQNSAWLATWLVAPWHE